MSEEADRSTAPRPGLGVCPARRRPFVPVLVGRTGGWFAWCERHQALWVLAQGARQQVVNRHARQLAREVLRLRALLPAEAAEVEKGKRGELLGTPGLGGRSAGG